MPNGHQIDCGERLTIEQVENLYSQMESVMMEYDEIELVADRVQQCDTASLQLILNFQRSSEKSGHKVQWRSPSDPILNVADLLGMTELLGLNEITQQ